MNCLPYIEREEDKIGNLARCPWNKFVCLEKEFQDLLHSGKYYVTPEMHAKVEFIGRGVSALKLSYHMFKKQQTCSSSVHTSGTMCVS